MDDTNQLASKPSTPDAKPASTSTSGAQRPAGGETLARVVQGAHAAVDGTAAKVAPVIDGVQAKVDGVKQAVGSAKDTVANGKQSLQDGVDKLVDTKDEWIVATRTAIREHPFAAIATALLVGAAYVSLRSPKR
jgi:ElaB/YqjD/DUF883 family membrane-anchored ribosome-binding protein